MRYQVRWKDSEGNWKYGIYREEQNGEAQVDDAVLPIYHDVPVAQLEDVECVLGTYNRQTGEFEGGDLFIQHVQEEHRKAREVDEALGDEFAPGRLFSVGVADGKAFYVVTKVNKRSCDVEWRGFGLDRYTDAVLGWGGRFPREQIERLCGAARGLRNLFRKKGA